jgi:hypothetical protein
MSDGRAMVESVALASQSDIFDGALIVALLADFVLNTARLAVPHFRFIVRYKSLVVTFSVDPSFFLNLFGASFSMYAEKKAKMFYLDFLTINYCQPTKKSHLEIWKCIRDKFAVPNYCASMVLLILSSTGAK